MATHNAAQDLRHLQRHDVLGREEQGCPGDDQGQTDHDGISVPEAFGCPPIDQKADELSHIRALSKSLL